MVGERRDVGVVVAQLRAERGQQCQDLQGGGLADVAYPWLVADAEQRDARALCSSLGQRVWAHVLARIRAARARTKPMGAGPPCPAAEPRAGPGPVYTPADHRHDRPALVLGLMVGGVRFAASCAWARFASGRASARWRSPVATALQRWQSPAAVCSVDQRVDAASHGDGLKVSCRAAHDGARLMRRLSGRGKG